MKRVLFVFLSLIMALGLTLPQAKPALASVPPAWNITGPWDLRCPCTSGYIGSYDHHMNIASEDPSTGALTGTGYYIPAPSFTWVIDPGSYVSGNAVHIELHYTAGHPVDWKATWDATINPSTESMAGTWSDTGAPLSSSGTFYSLTGHATVLLKTTPTITWSNPADITYPTALSGSQLNATASVPGSFVYTPAAGTVLGAGNNQNLHVDFTPNDTSSYNSASADVKINVLKANANIVVTPYNVTYDGAAHTATGTATGVAGVPLSGLNLTGTTHTAAGNYPSDPWSFTDSTGNYNNANGTVSDNIAKANANIDVTPYSANYNGLAHRATGNAWGLLGEDLTSGLNLDGTTHTNVGNYPSDPWSFISPSDNYNNANGTLHDDIGAPTPSAMTIFIEHAKIDFKDKPDDDKVAISGDLLFDQAGGMPTSKVLTITVGSFTDTVTMVAKGKKGEEWTYDRGKNGTGYVQKMTVHWNPKDMDFDLHMDRAQLDGMQNPVTVSIQIGNYLGTQTILMTEKADPKGNKDHWDYNAKEPKPVKP